MAILSSGTNDPLVKVTHLRGMNMINNPSQQNSIFQSLYFTAALIACLLVLLPNNGHASNIIGSIQFIQGDVHIIRHAKPLKAKENMEILELDTIKTTNQSRIRIKLFDQSIIQLGSNATTSIKQYTRSDNDVFNAFLDLIEGRARFVINKIRNASSNYRIKMHTTLIGVRGTDILAQAEGSIEHIALIEGRITLTDPLNKQRILNQGQYVRSQRPIESIPKQWLAAFMQDVGSIHQKSKKNKVDSQTSNPSLNNIIREKSSNILGTPSIVPE